MQPLEYRIILPDSSLRHVHAHPTLHERDGAKSGHIVGALRDISEWRVAEGIESAHTLQIVGDFGVDFAQGFHLGRPGLIEMPPRRRRA